MERVRAKLEAQGKKLTLEHKGNLDEFSLDLNAFANNAKGVLVLENNHVNIEVCFEKAPHITVIGAFLGRTCLPWLVVLSRESMQEHFACNLAEDSLVGLMGSKNGWVTGDIKSKAYQVWKNEGRSLLGKEPVLMSFGESLTPLSLHADSLGPTRRVPCLSRETDFQCFNRWPQQQHEQPPPLRQHDARRLRGRGDTRALHA